MIAPTPKQARALALRRAGWTWVKIAADLGISRGDAKLYADRAWLKEFRAQEAAKERA